MQFSRHWVLSALLAGSFFLLGLASSGAGWLSAWDKPAVVDAKPDLVLELASPRPSDLELEPVQDPKTPPQELGSPDDGDVTDDKSVGTSGEPQAPKKLRLLKELDLLDELDERHELKGVDDALQEAGELRDMPSEPRKEPLPLSRELLVLRDKVRSVLAYHLTRPEAVERRSPWGIMHALIAYGVDTEVTSGGTPGQCDWMALLERTVPRSAADVYPWKSTSDAAGTRGPRSRGAVSGDAGSVQGHDRLPDSN
jgi:hypothetical protein